MVVSQLSQKKKNKTKGAGMLLMLYKALYIAIQTGIFAFTWLETQNEYFLSGKTTMALAGVFFVFLIAFVLTYSAFEVHKASALDLCVKHTLSLALSDAIITVIVIIALKRLPDLSDLLMMVPVQLIIMVLWCITARAIHFKTHPAADAIIVYDDERAYDSINGIHTDKKNYNIVKTLNWSDYRDKIEYLQEILLEADVVFLCGIKIDERNQLFEFLIQNNIKVIVRPTIGDVLVTTAQREYLFNVPVLSYSSDEKSFFTLAAKRFIDIFVSFFMLLFASPVMLCVALAIKLEDKGPIFYKQKRLTKNAKVFEIIKFRSMRVDAEKDGVARLASDNDDRITKVGKIIRATRLDELPQLINIFKGEMSLIGPRPERPEIAEQYEEQIPEFQMRLKVKAGLTGYAQVYGKYNTTPYDKLQMDLMYIADMSLIQDIKIILLTIQIMFQKDSTEGVQQGNTTAIKEKTKK